MLQNQRSERASTGRGLRRLARILILTGTAFGLACGGNEITVDPNLSVPERWRSDLAVLTRQMSEVHPDLYHAVSKAAFEASVDRIHQAIPTLNDDEIFVEFLRLVALPAQERDGHTALTYFVGTDNDIVPLKFYRFADGVHVVQAAPHLAHLIGHRLVGIGSLPLEAVNGLIDPLIPRDNTNSLITARNLTYVTPAILASLGIVSDAAAPVFHFAAPTGEESSETILAVHPGEYGLDASINLPSVEGGPSYLTRRSEAFWLRYFEEQATLYLRFNRIAPSSDGESLSAFGTRMLAIVEEDAPERIIIDLRHNNGGNNQLIDGMMDVFTDPRIDRANRLLVFTDRQTFSAAGNFVASLADRTSATFVGTSPGGSGSQYGDVQRIDLPYSGIGAFIPTRHWVFGSPGFQPIQHPMDVTMEPVAADYFAGRDPLLEMYVQPGS